MTKEEKVDQIWTALANVLDPELHVSITDLGLVYDVTCSAGGSVSIKMTLTSMGCPLFPVIESSMKDQLSSLSFVKKVSIELTFDPPWSFDRMNETARAHLGI
ncbi:MAG: putative 1,2-phenylacetyl-CoA epoxidase, subunit D [Microgenomates bacterium OLB22]|nr:MAG: putative 1,2-phenylacetyl-CoA epoxidase, subunit D [Microgenomates bacterium OLB22]